MLSLYNTLTRQKEEFIPSEKGKVRMYTCGPTVYDYAHIGNFRAYVFEDTLKRYLSYKGFKVKHVMNLTDVDDKTIRTSQEDGVSLKEFTIRYEKAFFKDIDTLNIQRADHYPKATEHIKEMISLIKRLKEKGLAYRGEDGSYYFDISKFQEYGKLAHIKVENLKTGKKVKKDEYAKDELQDFALWKAYSREDGDVFWETDLGKGRPGWHIECSTMSMTYLGESFDIHAGGVDLIFPHHQNEIAQSEGATGKPFVRYWVHNEHLLVEGRKMSKSLGNFYTLRDLLEKGYDPVAIRYLLLSAHYRQKLNFTFKGLETATNTVYKLRDFMDKIREIEVGADWNKDLHGKVVKTREDFENLLDDDLNMPPALAAIFDLVKETNNAIAGKRASKENLDEVHSSIMAFDRVLGILEHEKGELDKGLLQLIEEREDARKNKDWPRADKIRDELFQEGIIVEDTSNGPRWRRTG
ncbi:MAG: cysteine--tRNA ligase [Candidatus Hydrothermarchaeales archaeon]